MLSIQRNCHYTNNLLNCDLLDFSYKEILLQLLKFKFQKFLRNRVSGWFSKSPSNSMETRGSLIVVEGVDRCGKTTQCELLVEKLKESNIKAEFIHFPDRTTPTGKLINDYLSKNTELSDQAIHLLFSANRWELEPVIKKKLFDGITLIVDRYSFSGVAYSAAKSSNMDIDWFKNPEIGLPKPDCVLYLQLEQLVANERKGFGEERYETSEFQKSVADCFHKLQDKTWKVINANKKIEELSEELYAIVTDVLEKSRNSPLLTLW